MLTERQALAMVMQGEARVPPLRIKFAVVEPRAADSRRFDWLLDIGWGGKNRRYAVEYISPATPRNLASARDRITSVLRSTDGLLPMVMAPYLSEDKLDVLAERQVSGIDFCGNAMVMAPGDWLVYRTGSPNRFPSTTPLRNVYAGTSSLVCRVLLSKGEFERLSDIQEAIVSAGGQISLGTVSKVVSALQDELLVSKKKGIRLVQPGGLLDRLAERYDPRAPVTPIRGRFADSDDLLPRLSRWARDTGLRFAVAGAGFYARQPSSDVYPPVYTDRPDELAQEFEFEVAARFATAEIRGTQDPLRYFDARRADGVTWQSPLQTYLEMMQGGKRGRELAAALRQQILGGVT